MTDRVVNAFFSYAPLAFFLVVFATLYFSTRTQEPGTPAPSGKTYACAGCGRRGPREQMNPVSEQGAVLWYCSRCSPRAQEAH